MNAPAVPFASDRSQSPVRILYIGPDSGTCRARRYALERLGHKVLGVDPFVALPAGRFARSWSFKTGGLGFSRIVRKHIASAVGAQHFDLAYVDSGELIDARAVRMMRQFAPVVVNYNPDNPYESRDGWRWRAFLTAVPEYDRMFVPRQSNVDQALAAGAKAVERVWFAADDLLKNPESLPSEEAKAPYRSPVSFVGTWMPERGPLLLRLIELGVPLRILGPRWDKAPEYSALAPHVTLGALDPQAYDAAVAAADISIALLSKGNCDFHTTRSLEIPSLGSLLCGERTDEHSALYKEGDEAMFWSSPEECAALCLELIDDPARRCAMAQAGRMRAIANNHFNEPLMADMVARSLGIAASSHAEKAL